MTQFNEMYRSCLVTTEFSNTRHKDAWDVMSSEDTALWLDKFLEDSGNQRINPMKEQYVENLLRCMMERHQSGLSLETTCAWTLVEDNEEYEFRQYFANLSCGVALDISSTGFEKADQMGSTFLGALFDHCTTRPIWQNKAGGTISFNRPPGSDNYVFAWGNHRSKRKKNQNHKSIAKKAANAKKTSKQQAQRDQLAKRQRAQDKLAKQRARDKHAKQRAARAKGWAEGR